MDPGREAIIGGIASKRGSRVCSQLMHAVYALSLMRKRAWLGPAPQIIALPRSPPPARCFTAAQHFSSLHLTHPSIVPLTSSSSHACFLTNPSAEKRVHLIIHSPSWPHLTYMRKSWRHHSEAPLQYSPGCCASTTAGQQDNMQAAPSKESNAIIPLLSTALLLG